MWPAREAIDFHLGPRLSAFRRLLGLPNLVGEVRSPVCGFAQLSVRGGRAVGNPQLPGGELPHRSLRISHTGKPYRVPHPWALARA